MTHLKRFPSPPHAYVPGLTNRHAPDLFATICATANPGMPVTKLLASDAWAAGLQFLNTGYYWEAHEAFEPVWQALPPRAPERNLVRALIQLANARLKAKMERPKAVIRLCDQVDALSASIPYDTFLTSNIQRDDLIQATRQLRAEVIHNLQNNA